MGRPLQRLLLGSLAIRLVLIAWCEIQDKYFEVNYTDIDYIVFTDAARYISKGLSPFERATYRYSPLLAYALLPNIYVHQCFGKVMHALHGLGRPVAWRLNSSVVQVLFAFLDVIAAVALSSLVQQYGLSRRHSTWAAAAWLLNPFTATISTRGSCDVIVIVMMLSVLWLLNKRQLLAAGALYGLAVHFRLYPIIYTPSILLAILGPWTAASLHKVATDRHPCTDHAAAPSSLVDLLHTNAPLNPRCKALDKLQLSTHPACLYTPHPVLNPWLQCSRAALFGVVSLASFAALGWAFYSMYGAQFVREAYTFHLTRQDPRHNFSPYFYATYLRHFRAPADGAAAAAGGSPLRHPGGQVDPGALAVIPQAAAILLLSLRFHQHLPLCWSLLTISFVAFNKVGPLPRASHPCCGAVCRLLWRIPAPETFELAPC
jgi:GPI mannosyltransferase 1 subunit M